MIYPARYDMTIEQRATFQREFALTDVDGAPMDFTGYTLSAALWTASRRHIIDLTLSWIDQTEGSFTLSLTDEQTTTLSGAAMWDLLVENPDDTKDYYLRGEVLIEKGFTE